MIRVIMDTNIFISALFQPNGLPAEQNSAWLCRLSHFAVFPSGSVVVIIPGSGQSAELPLKLVSRPHGCHPIFGSELKIAKKNGISSTRASRGKHSEEQGCRIRVLLASQHMRTV
jgi:hypothetical protein